MPIRFVDFAIRAWREGPYIQVVAHSTPAGGMRQPVAVKLGSFAADDYRIEFDAPLSRGADVGTRLAQLLFPDAVWRLLGESLQVVAPHPELGLRVRLCLDDDLIDLPWEFLYFREVDVPVVRSSFLLLDGRISLVREPPSLVVQTEPSDRTRRGLFVGTRFDDGSDYWEVAAEYRSLTAALGPVRRLLNLSYVEAHTPDAVDEALSSGCDLFHYAGHIEIENGRGCLVQLARRREPTFVEARAKPSDWTRSEHLAERLFHAGTRLAVFNACNSGFWPFVRPFMHSGIQALVGVQGLLSNVAALNFAAKLYESLAVGLSLDEALTYARLYMLERGRSACECDWGRFMAYMPTEAAVLFPRPERKTNQRHQREVREARNQTISDARLVAEHLDGPGVSSVLTDIASRSVLILGRFTDDRKAVLDRLKDALSVSPRRYVPILFDFEKPEGRDLIESIVRFAAVSRFVIADLSDPKSVPAELQAIVPQFPSLPVVPIIEADQLEYPVSDHILRRESVTKPVVRYRDGPHLIEILEEQVLTPAEMLHRRLKPVMVA